MDIIILMSKFERNFPTRHFVNALHPFDAACIGIYVYRIFAAFLLTGKLHGKAPKAIILDFGKGNLHC